jgi:hypothetical protein
MWMNALGTKKPLPNEISKLKNLREIEATK